VKVGPKRPGQHENAGWTRPTVLTSVCPAMALGSVAGTGGWLERTLRAIQVAIASWRSSRPLLATGRKLVTPGGLERPSPRRACDRLARVTQSPLGFPAGPGTVPFAKVEYSNTVV